MEVKLIHPTAYRLWRATLHIYYDFRVKDGEKRTRVIDTLLCLVRAKCFKWLGKESWKVGLGAYGFQACHSPAASANDVYVQF